MEREENTPSIKKNYLFNTLYQVISIVFTLFSASYVAKVLGPEGTGVLGFTNSIVAYFAIFAALGKVSYGQREIAMHRGNTKDTTRLFWEIELLSVCSTIVALLAWIVWIIVSPQYTIYYIVLSIGLITVSFDITWFYSGLEKFDRIVLMNFMVRVIDIIALILFIKSNNDTLLYMGIINGVGLLGHIYMWMCLPRFIFDVKLKELHPFRGHLKQTLAYFIPTVATSIYTVLDKTMIGGITSSLSENGYYEQATKLINAMKALLFSLNTVLTTRQSFLFSGGRLSEIKEKINMSFEYMFLLSIPFMFGMMGIASNFVPWFFGGEYNAVVILLYIMSPLPFIICISNVLGSQYLTPSGQRVRSSKAIIIGSIVNLLLNIVLIPRYKASGAAVASCVAESVISIIYVYMSKGYTSWLRLGKIAYKKIIAAICMLIVIVAFGRGKPASAITTLLQVILGMVTYLGGLLLLGDRFVLTAIKMMKGIVRSKDG